MSATAYCVRETAIDPCELCKHFSLTAEAKALLVQGAGCREFLTALIGQRQYMSAIDFVAHALPAREAIWWGCLCFQHASGGSFTPQERAACKAAVQWVMRPCESARVAAKAPAEVTGARSAAGSLATAAHQTGGSIGPAHVPPIPPGRYAPAKAVAMAVKLASLHGHSAASAQRQRSYAELGMEMMQTVRVI